VDGREGAFWGLTKCLTIAKLELGVDGLGSGFDGREGTFRVKNMLFHCRLSADVSIVDDLERFGSQNKLLFHCRQITFQHGGVCASPWRREAVCGSQWRREGVCGVPGGGRAIWGQKWLHAGGRVCRLMGEDGYFEWSETFCLSG